ncbi:formiminotransferase N-terminal subdomain-containing protein isoform X2 [Scleropages formosus]|uniref:Formiminotransferase cyclodeaminase N-terminal like 1 n=1 Tax=Scleropages formosus TaxID=113540 RepID=A0A8C9RB18_SCLFO|nr:formiminotransferase N-terminal subdomain-containing protein isoform X2 [Scleropages formosus]
MLIWSWAGQYCRPSSTTGHQMGPLAAGRRLVACLLNISEARNRDAVEKVARAAARKRHGGWREGTSVLNIFSDRDYNRSVITISASVESVGEAVLSACEEACRLVDVRNHIGVHPCLGAVDLIPLYPLGEDVGLEECGIEARVLAARLTELVPGTAAFYFGSADMPLHRGLAQRRKEIGWFRKTTDLSCTQPDVGGRPQSRYGLTGVGASPYVMNCNVTITTEDLSIGRKVASGLRESTPGGLPGVQVLALPHKGAVEIACNVESVQGAPPAEHWPSFSVGGSTYYHIPASLISTRVAELAGQHGVDMEGALLVGFTPQECRLLAEHAISQGIGEYWREQHGARM